MRRMAALAAEDSGESAAGEAVEGEAAADEAAPGEIPNAKVLAEAMRHVDYSKVEIDGNTVRLVDPKMELDLGGIAKGYIADRVTAFLEEKGVRSAIVDLGGNIVALGGKARSMLDTEAGKQTSASASKTRSPRAVRCSAPCLHRI